MKKQTFLKPYDESKIENSREFLWILTQALKSPFHGFGQFHSPQMKPCKSPDYLFKVSFHIVVDMRQGESNIFQILTRKAFLLLKIYSL